ncbi:O-antigen ligase family protein [Streptomyces longwoodensis]|uniref:O-antigen ligase family protein n=1 Tax=Streptomyces longwoodensis TaxID=68231 RepID=UPI0037FD9553
MVSGQSGVVLGLGVLALLSLGPVVVALRRARAHGDWDLTATLVCATGLLASLPSVVYILRGGRSEQVDAFGDVEIGFPGWVDRVGTVANGLLLVVCLAFVVHRLLLRRPRVLLAPLLACALVVVLALSDGVHGQQFLAPRQLVLIAVLCAAAVARPGRPAFVGAAAAVLLFTVLSGAEALLSPAAVLRECRPDNPCGLLGIHYAGVFTNENIFSLVLVLGMPFVWLGLRGGVRVLLVCYLAFLAVVTGSRLAGAAALATLALLALLRPRLDGACVRPAAWRTLLTLPLLAATALAGLVLPFDHPGPARLGDRAVIWDMARAELSRSPLTGLGGTAWSAKYPAGEIPAAVSPSLHNQWIDVLFAGGLLGLALFVLLLLYLALRGGVAGLPVAGCVLLPVLLCSVVERPWSFGISNSLTFLLVAAVLLPVPAPRAAGAAAPASGASRAAAPGRTPRPRSAATAGGR